MWLTCWPARRQILVCLVCQSHTTSRGGALQPALARTDCCRRQSMPTLDPPDSRASSTSPACRATDTQDSNWPCHTQAARVCPCPLASSRHIHAASPATDRQQAPAEPHQSLSLSTSVMAAYCTLKTAFTMRVMSSKRASGSVSKICSECNVSRRSCSLAGSWKPGCCLGGGNCAAVGTGAAWACAGAGVTAIAWGPAAKVGQRACLAVRWPEGAGAQPSTATGADVQQSWNLGDCECLLRMHRGRGQFLCSLADDASTLDCACLPSAVCFPDCLSCTCASLAESRSWRSLLCPSALDCGCNQTDRQRSIATQPQLHSLLLPGTGNAMLMHERKA